MMTLLVVGWLPVRAVGQLQRDIMDSLRIPSLYTSLRVITRLEYARGPERYTDSPHPDSNPHPGHPLNTYEQSPGVTVRERVKRTQNMLYSHRNPLITIAHVGLPASHQVAISPKLPLMPKNWNLKHRSQRSV